MMRRGTLGVGALVLAAAVAWAQQATPTGMVPVQPAPETRAGFSGDAAIYAQHLATLSNPFMEGRAPGTEGVKRAAEYLEFHFRRLGLTPAFPTYSQDTGAQGDEAARKVAAEFSTFRQEFEAPTSRRPGDSYKLKAQRMETVRDAKADAWTPGVDFNPIGFSASGEASGQAVFVGYGVRSEARKYDSLPAGTDLKGKIAIVMRFEPMNEKGKSLWSDEGWSPNAGLAVKLNNVARAGAAGIVLVSAPGADDPRRDTLEDLGLMPERGGALKVPVVMASIDAVDRFVKSTAGRSLMELRREADALPLGTSGVVELPGADLSIQVEIQKIPLMTDNVGAVLKGRGSLASEYIVIGAHYDHVGYGYFSSRGGAAARGKLHPGADDNASGTSGMLLAAERLKREYDALPEGANARSILFMGFSAEESGLNGSRHYVKNMIAPKENHDLMINLDMIGRMRKDQMELHGIGSAAGLDAWVQPFVDKSGLKIALRRSGTGPSDHASFYGAGIPVLFFFTGLHDQYHAPGDTFETINVEGALKVVDMVASIAMAAATRSEGFEYVGPSSKPAAGEGDQAVRPVRNRVRFGIAPGDYSGDTPGVLVGQVFAGTPAAKAGVKEGDIITTWNNLPVTDVETWMPMLQEAKPGDVVRIVVKRGKEELPLEVKLEARAEEQR